ncbi:calexcitin-1-like [Limulus polyphemus]|uniref:Calexcitin-1-like n=1 Tax=Limulus polyphemus TaxID=6850 RepID=A0ABM1SUH2_LIMPO|nr:calexcitin-1-like [Limulus polyphemus]
MGQSLEKHGEKDSFQLSQLRKKKLLCEFNTFFDINKDGVITLSDFHSVRERICKLNGWKPGSDKYDKTEELFRDIWESLKEQADSNHDNKITQEEWIRMWEQINEAESQGKINKFPHWLTSYLWYRFNMYDRTCDGIVDVEEFCYVLESFGIPERQSRQCFVIMTQNETKPLNFDYFCKLAGEYYRSDDPGALGNFITGRLAF